MTMVAAVGKGENKDRVARRQSGQEGPCHPLQGMRVMVRRQQEDTEGLQAKECRGLTDTEDLLRSWLLST